LKHKALESQKIFVVNLFQQKSLIQNRGKLRKPHPNSNPGIRATRPKQRRCDPGLDGYPVVTTAAQLPQLVDHMIAEQSPWLDYLG